MSSRVRSLLQDALLATTHFYRGDPSPETELLGLMFSCTAHNLASFQPGEEHSEYQWLTAPEALEKLPEDFWLAELIRRAELHRQLASQLLPADRASLNKFGRPITSSGQYKRSR